MRFSNILLVVDADGDHSPAFDRAIALARNERARLTVCDVVDSVPANFRRIITAVTPAEVLELVVAAKLDWLTKHVQNAGADDVEIDIKVLVGKPHAEIARLVSDDDHDLVIKSVARQRGRVRSRSVSREDRQLMRSCPCPIWMVNVTDLAKDSCILAALDFPGDGTADSKLNEHILRVSRSVALAEFRPLHIVHAWKLAGESHFRARGNAQAIMEIDRNIVEEEGRRTAWLREAVNRTQSDSERIATDYLAPELHVIKGDARKVVPDLAKNLSAGMIVMGTAARTGVSGLLLGNTSEMVLSRSECSFLIVRQPESLSMPPAASVGAGS